MSVIAMLLAALAFGQDAAHTEALEAEALYRLGLELVVAEEFEEACDAFQRVSEEYPQSTMVERADEQARLIALAHPDSACATTSALVRRERGGRAELIVSQSLVGPALFGLFIPFSFEGDEVAVPVIGAFLGLGLGLGGTYWLTGRYPVSEGQAMAIYTGEILGGWNGAWIALASEADDEKVLFQALTAGTVAGGAAALGAAVAWSPDPGEMALLRGGAVWGTYAAAATLLMFEPVDKDIGHVIRLGVGTDAGALIGWGLSRWVAGHGGITRIRVNFINLGGYAGALVGGGLGLLAYEYLDASDDVMGSLLLGGATVGIGVAVYLTRNMTSPTLAASDGVLFAHDTDGWRVGLPMPLLVPDRDGGVAVSVPLARGEF